MDVQIQHDYLGAKIVCGSFMWPLEVGLVVKHLYGGTFSCFYPDSRWSWRIEDSDLVLWQKRIGAVTETKHRLDEISVFQIYRSDDDTYTTRNWDFQEPHFIQEATMEGNPQQIHIGLVVEERDPVKVRQALDRLKPIFLDFIAEGMKVDLMC
jgi:hypothetical protein